MSNVLPHPGLNKGKVERDVLIKKCLLYVITRISSPKGLAAVFFQSGVSITHYTIQLREKKTFINKYEKS